MAAIYQKSLPEGDYMRLDSTRMKIVVGLLVIGMMISGCAGRNAAPIAQYQYGDDKKKCEHLKAEISELQSEIATKTQKCQSKKDANIALGITGAILFWPALFFMDLSEADQIELEALRKRHNALVRLCADKDCGFDYKDIPPFQTAKTEDTAAKDIHEGTQQP